MFSNVRSDGALRLFRASGLFAGTLLFVQSALAHPDPDVPDDAILDIVVEQTPSDDEDTHARTTVDQAELSRAAGQDLAESIAGVAGVTTARGGSDNAKPIIRGQQERRLLLLFDGVRHENQKWGMDHAPELDPFSAGAIEVVRGAAGVRYGPDAIGGVVLVEPRPLRSRPGVDGGLRAVGVSNGRRAIVDARLDGASEQVPGLAWRVHANVSQGADLQAPTYVLGNTASQVWNADATVHQELGSHHLKLTYRHYDLSAGLCFCAADSTVETLRSGSASTTPVGADAWTSDYHIQPPRQKVTHDMTMVRGVFSLPGGAVIRSTYALQLNHRQEFEPARGDASSAQYDFSLWTQSFDTVLLQADRSLGERSHLEGGLGIDTALQENIYSGLPLIPNHRSFSIGAYAYERWVGPTAAIELGGRYDHQDRTSYLTSTAYQGHLARETLSPDDCEADGDVSRCGQAYDTASVSLGGLWHAVPDALDLRLDLSSASRFPNADELYMNGTAPTSPVYALGNPGLRAETTWGASPTVGAEWRSLSLEVSGYGNYTDDFVYFAPSLDGSGAPAIDVTIRGAFPRYAFTPIDALFYGVDGQFSAGEHGPVRLVLQGAAVRAIDTQTGLGLVGIPADNASLSASYHPPIRGVDDPYVRVRVGHTARQSHVPAGADLTPAPDAYTLLGAGLGAQFPRDRVTWITSIEANNLLNTSYRSYTSLLRYFADEPGREFRVQLGLDF